MNSVPRFFNRFRTLFHREQRERDLRAGGVAPDAAHRAAVRELGNGAKLKQQSHEVILFRLEAVWHDLRFSTRQLERNPGFTTTAILMLALGIGSSVAIFAFADAALIKPLPYQSSDALLT
jgi:hypothetical protein